MDKSNAHRDSLKYAFGNNPSVIIAIVGESYKQFVYNMEQVFPGKGKYIAKQICDNKQDSLYRTFPVVKKRSKSKKERKIFSPVDILKALQKLIVEFAESQFTSHPCSHGFVAGRSTRTAAESLRATPHINEKEVTNIDVSGAFPAIEGKAIRTLLRHQTKMNLTPWQVKTIARIACNSDDRLATGAPSSPILFNWRLTAVDNEIEKAFKSRNWDFIRYADDISVIHYRSQKKEAVSLIIKILSKFGLRIAREKLKTFHGDLKKVVGINLQKGELSIPRALRRTTRAVIFQLRKKGVDVRVANQYHTGLARFNLKRIDKKAAKVKGSIESVAAGFMAYVIHVHKLILRTPEETAGQT